MLVRQLEAENAKLFVIKFFTFFLLNASFVPIGLYVTMKLARSFQKVMLEYDNELVYVNEEVKARTNGEGGTYRLIVRAVAVDSGRSDALVPLDFVAAGAGFGSPPHSRHCECMGYAWISPLLRCAPWI